MIYFHDYAFLLRFCCSPVKSLMLWQKIDEDQAGNLNVKLNNQHCVFNITVFLSAPWTMVTKMFGQLCLSACFWQSNAEPRFFCQSYFTSLGIVRSM